MNTHWPSDFRLRMEQFVGTAPDSLAGVSIKVRITSGCFHREHSPQAYKIIDEHVSKTDMTKLRAKIEEHETGPEILVLLAVTTAGLTFAKSIVDLASTIIKARSEGIAKGDKPSEPLELIIRGHSKDGEYFEETILRIPHDQIINTKVIEDALAQSGKAARKTKKKNPRKR